MPRRPAASSTANVRYGLHAESGLRTSTRRDDALCGVYIGTRTSAERLAAPHDAAVGASPPCTSRLYEFTHLLVTALISLACSRMPAMNDLPTSDSCSGSLGSWKALVSPSNRLMWVCMAEPGYSAKGWGMNEARTPSPMATSLTTYRNVITLSAMDS